MIRVPEDEAWTLESDRLVLSPMVRDDAEDLFGFCETLRCVGSREGRRPLAPTTFERESVFGRVAVRLRETSCG